MKRLFLISVLSLALLAACAGAVPDLQVAQNTKADVVIYMAPT